MTRTLPEPRSREAHEHVKRLRDELHRIRAEKPGTGVALDAFVRYMHESALLGLSPTALPEYSPVEADRFFARVVEGPDGHRYWMWTRPSFRRNNRSTQHPRRWWWEHEHDVVLDLYDDLVPHCGDPHCIAPAHASIGRALARQIFSDEQMLAALRAMARQLGHPPSKKEWDESHWRPSSSLISMRLGGWNKAILAAGMRPLGHDRKRL